MIDFRKITFTTTEPPKTENVTITGGLRIQASIDLDMNVLRSDYAGRQLIALDVVAKAKLEIARKLWAYAYDDLAISVARAKVALMRGDIRQQEAELDHMAKLLDKSHPHNTKPTP